jgi:hypothetical protein
LNLSQAQILTNGTCVGPANCGLNSTFYQCPAIAVFIPPSCPDNCSANGICVNISTCLSLDAENIRLHGNDKSKWSKPSCGLNYNFSVANNYNTTCACFAGYSGINCGDVGFLIIVGILAGGIIAGIIIVVVAVICFGFVGGSAYAVSASTNREDSSGIHVSPLYKPATRGSDVQLH